MAKTKKFPAALGECVDLAYRLRAERLEKQKEYDEAIDSMKAEEEALKSHILNTFKKSEIEGARGKICTASVKLISKFRPKDFMSVWDWARKNNQPQIFEKRLAQAAMQELVAEQVEVPGVETYTLIELSLVKR